MVATLVLIIIKIFLFVVSNEISVTLKQNYIDTKFLENSYVVFKLKSQINCFKLAIKKTLLWFILLHSIWKNYIDKLEATTTFIVRIAPYKTFFWLNLVWFHINYEGHCEVVLNMK